MLIEMKEVATVKSPFCDLKDMPLLDVKPYIENFDRVDGKVRSGWMNASSDEVSGMHSDERFIK